jgi:Ser/Thr protein kinase RdoA (MazF antagonist)
MDPLFAGQPKQRIHGDCHMGNLLLGREGFFWIDFDDMIMGPPVQDLWLMVPGRDAEARQQMNRLLSGYREFADFSQDSLRLIEPLRTLRFIHYASWIAHRWEDPAFKNAFPYFGTDRYWQEWMADLYDQKAMLESGEVPLL